MTTPRTTTPQLLVAALFVLCMLSVTDPVTDALTHTALLVTFRGQSWFVGRVDAAQGALGPQQAPQAHTEAQNAPEAAVAPLGSLQGPPSMSAEQIDAVLASYGSPAARTGATWIALGRQYGIDPAYALAWFIHESSAGTAGAAVDTRSVGNIECAGYPTCSGRWRSYANWMEGLEDWYRLLTREYFPRGLTTVETIVPVYAPASENDVSGYISAVNGMVEGWRAATSGATSPNQPTAAGRQDRLTPAGSPLRGRVVMTQGYGVGSHAPASIWGAVDLVQRTPEATYGAPVYATMDGTARVSSTWPCGTGVEILNTHYRTLYCHLSSVSVSDGAVVQAGQQVAAVGSTGESSGPHLHYEIWRDGLNVNPMEYLR